MKCLFCKVINKELSAKIKFEDELFIAIHDINPQAPTHLLIIPKKHLAQISDATDHDKELFGQLILRAKELASQEKLESYRLVFNNGAGAGQSVFHIHLHLIGGRRMNWPPG